MIDPHEIARGLSGTHKRRAAETYEDLIVSMLLTRFKLTKFKHELAVANQETVGDKRLTLDGFMDFFPSFPVYPVARIIKNVATKVTPARMWTFFTQDEDFLETLGDLVELM